MDERSGRAILHARFTAAGLAIEEDVRFTEEGVEVVLDGYDPARRIGYEYITTEAGDRESVTPEVVAALEARMVRGDLFVLLVDEHDVPGPEALSFAADGFLAVLRERGLLS